MSSKYKKNIVRFIYILFFVSQLSSTLHASEHSCNLDEFEKILLSDLSLYKKTRVAIYEGSSGGGEAIIYESTGGGKIIKSNFAGETGRANINFYFKSKNDKHYLVDFKEYFYTRSVYDPSSKVAITSFNRFVVCEGFDYPNKNSLGDLYDRAINILKNIESYQ